MMQALVISLFLILTAVTIGPNWASAQTCPQCLPGDATACGDPHMVGFNGKHFDYAKTGESVLLKESDGFEVKFIVTTFQPGSGATFITGIRCRGPGGPWMRIIAASGDSADSAAVVTVDGVDAALGNGAEFTDSASSLKIQKSISGFQMWVTAPRWMLLVAQVVGHKDPFFNIDFLITSPLKTPVTGVLGSTYDPVKFHQNMASKAISMKHHGTSGQLPKGPTLRGLLHYYNSPIDDEGIELVTSDVSHNIQASSRMLLQQRTKLPAGVAPGTCEVTYGDECTNPYLKGCWCKERSADGKGKLVKKVSLGEKCVAT